MILSGLFFALFVLSGVYLFRFTKRFLKMEDTIDDALDILDGVEESITESLQKPLFFDNPEIRKTVEDIKRARTAVIEIANSIQYAIKYEEDKLDEEELKKQLLQSGNVIRLDLDRDKYDH